MRPDRVVIGVESRARAARCMRELYRPLYLIETPILFTALETAELIKYAANAFLAIKITFINEIADLCEKVGADVQRRRARHRPGRPHRRASSCMPGPGYGGSCFPKDTLALVRTARRTPARRCASSRPWSTVNDARKEPMAEQDRRRACGGIVDGQDRSRVLGLTFKPNTDDMRDSPSLVIVPALQAAGATVRAFDPRGHGRGARSCCRTSTSATTPTRR